MDKLRIHRQGQSQDTSDTPTRRKELQKQGEEILNEFLDKHDMKYTNAIADQLAAFHEAQKREIFFQSLAEKTIILGEKDIDELQGKHKKLKNGKGWRKYVPFLSYGKNGKGVSKPLSLFIVPEKFNRKKPIFITDDNITQYKFMHCCHPIPGDDILGFIDNKSQVEIHKRSCPVATKLKSSFGNRILDAKWDMHKRLYFDATIHLKGIDRIGMLNEVTKVISEQMNVNIHKITLSSDEGIFDGIIELRVHDRDDVMEIINSLKKIDNMQKVNQIM